MKPPFAARALVAAATPAADYESVAGDLDEEYGLRVRTTSRARANQWYWSQAVRSVPALLSYSRCRRAPGAHAATAALVVAILLAMLFGKEAVDALTYAVYPSAHRWLFFLVDWSDAAIFGALLAAVDRTSGVRFTLIASVGLVVAFTIPVLLGISAPLSAPAWLLLLGAVPAMTGGAAAYHVARRTMRF